MELFFAVTLQNLLIFMNYFVLAKPKYFKFSIKQSLVSMVLIILSGLSFLYIQKYMIIVTAISLIITGLIIFRSTVIKTINTVSISLGTFLLVDYFIVFILSLIEKKYGFLFSNFAYLLIVALPSIATSKVIKSLIKDFENKVLLFVVMPTVVILYAINIYSMRIELNSRNIILILSIFIIIVLFALLLLMLYYRRQQKIYLKQYYDELENSFNDIREFRHDYKNLIVALGMLVENEDLPGIKTFYNSMTEYQKNEIISGSYNLERLTNIRIDYLRGFLFSKIREAEIRNVDIFVEVSDKIESVNMNRVDLIRVLGIILDNAIEEVETIGRGTVSIIFIKIDSGVVISVENDCREDIERVHQLREKNFSSKGEKRGLGLYILDEILRKENQIHHELRIDNGKFIQKLEIKDKS